MQSEGGNDQRRGLFLALASMSGLPTILFDAAGTPEYADQKACDLLDCARPELLKAKWQEIAPLFELPAPLPFPTHLSSAEIPSAGGARRLSLQLHALDKSAGAGHFAILKDRRSLNPLERELLLASEQRGWDYQRETLMHDLKGILNSMHISLELLSDTDAEMPQASSPEGRRQRRIASIKADLVRMDRALRALPGADGNAEPAVTDFDVREVLTEIFAALRQLVRRSNVELKLDMGDASVMARGRRPWIKQALLNVVVHRLNAMRAGGSLAVEALMTDEAVSVILRNDVPDMRQGLIDENFAFFCAGRSNSGANDLHVARFIFESHGGAMEVASDGAASTEFVLRLPR